MALIQFTRNHDDLSTDKGYQFKFNCDKCGNGYMSRFVPSAIGMAGSALQAAGNFFGGLLGRASSSAHELQRMAQGKGHDDAFAKAVEEAKVHFKQCSRCGKWVCPDVCWNAKRGLCEECAPDLAEEVAATQAEEQVRQAKEKIAKQDLLQGVDVVSEATVRCPKCDKDVKGGKFCPECGAKLQETSECPKCGTAVAPGTKFCPECGTRMGG
jgi:membrane protease subunit (stomatin/prohibitin family)